MAFLGSLMYLEESQCMACQWTEVSVPEVCRKGVKKTAKTVSGSKVWHVDEKKGAEITYEGAQQAVGSCTQRDLTDFISATWEILNRK